MQLETTQAELQKVKSELSECIEVAAELGREARESERAHSLALEGRLAELRSSDEECAMWRAQCEQATAELRARGQAMQSASSQQTDRITSLQREVWTLLPAILFSTLVYTF